MKMLKIDAAELAYSRNAVLGIPDSGKSVTAKKLAEHLMNNGVPIVALDPAGNWRYLRTPGLGKGFPVVVIGGAASDIKDVAGEVFAHVASDANAGVYAGIMRAAMKAGVSIVFDLYDSNMSKGEWRRIVMQIATVLYYENKDYGLRHIFLEEAAEFIPQIVRNDTSAVFSVLDKIIRMGRNAALGITLINQRAEDVNKSALELCDNMFLHRQRGRNSLANLQKWLEIASDDGDAPAGLIASLSTLPQGTCWHWAAGSKAPEKLVVPMIESFHPNVRDMIGASSARDKKEPVDVSVFLDKLRAALPKAPPPMPKDTAEGSVARFKAVHEDELMFSKADLAAEYQRGVDDGYSACLEKFERVAKDVCGQMGEALETAKDAVENIGKVFDTLEDQLVVPEITGLAQAREIAAKIGEIALRDGEVIGTMTGIKIDATRPPRAQAGDRTLSNPQLRLLQTLAWWRQLGHAEVSRTQAAVICGWAATGSNIRDRVSELVTRKMIDRNGDRISLTPLGIRAAPSPNMERSTADTVRAVLSTPQARLFDVLLAHRGRKVARDSVAKQLGWEPEGSNIRDRCSELKSMEIIQIPERGFVALRDWVLGR